MIAIRLTVTKRTMKREKGTTRERNLAIIRVNKTHALARITSGNNKTILSSLTIVNFWPPRQNRFFTCLHNAVPNRMSLSRIATIINYFKSIVQTFCNNHNGFQFGAF